MPIHTEQSIAGAIAAIRARIDAAARQAGRDPDAVTLVAVSKTHTTDAVRQALAAGQTVFGENRVQEAAGKFPGIAGHLPGYAPAPDRTVADQ